MAHFFFVFVFVCGALYFVWLTRADKAEGEHERQCEHPVPACLQDAMRLTIVDWKWAWCCLFRVIIIGSLLVYLFPCLWVVVGKHFEVMYPIW